MGMKHFDIPEEAKAIAREFKSAVLSVPCGRLRA